jgi:hypothetical protein
MRTAEEIDKIIEEKEEKISHLLHRQSKDEEYKNYHDAEAKQIDIEQLEIDIEKLQKEKATLTK